MDNDTGTARRQSVRRAAAALGGVVCWALAQALMLDSREPLRPAALYLLGFVLLLPLLQVPAPATSPRPHAAALPRRTPHRTTATALTYAFAAATAAGLLAVLWGIAGTFTLAALVLWSVGMAALWALFAAPIPAFDLRAWGQKHGADLLACGALTLLALWVAAVAPAPITPLTLHTRQLETLAATSAPPSDGTAAPTYLLLLRAAAGTAPGLPYLQGWSTLFVALLAPAIYLLARQHVTRGGALWAAGLAVGGPWTLALAKSGTVYPALACAAALYLAALSWALRAEGHAQRYACLLAGAVLGGGLLVSPLITPLALLLPGTALLRALDERRRWGTQVTHAAAGLLLAGMTALPALLAGRWTLNVPVNFEQRAGLDSAAVAADSLAHGLLMFNLTRDPDAAHGILHRPAFAPSAAALFAVGLLVWGWRRQNSLRDAFPLLALVAALLPAALSLALPPAYPNLWLAAPALPAAALLTGLGAARLLDALHDAAGRWGAPIAAALLLACLIVSAWDAQTHYRTAALPAYETAAQTFFR